ncbi:MAG: hypothetical protein NW206_19490 [Hyphomonadaceae bacterium]|nr:hypothetical protein [Hyphomonadaceae bacterium]
MAKDSDESPDDIQDYEILPEHLAALAGGGLGAVDDSHGEATLGEDEFDPLTAALNEPTVGYTLLEKLCLAIIRAYPPAKEDTRTNDLRLRAAMYALTGSYYRHDKRDKDDRLLLYWMAAQWLRQERCVANVQAESVIFGDAGADRPFGSTTSLAAAALAWLGEPITSTADSAVRRLRSAFEEDEEALVQTVRVASATPHVIEHKILTRVLADLHHGSVRVVLPTRPAAF